MGNRSYIQVESTAFATPVVLYGHWSGTDNLTAVRNVLASTARIGDPSYLTAQLFFAFAIECGNYDGQLSFGISTGEVSDETDWVNEPTVYVNADTGEYKVNSEVFTEYCRPK